MCSVLLCSATDRKGQRNAKWPVRKGDSPETFLSQLNEGALIQPRGISISMKGKIPVILFKRVVRIPSGKKEIVWTARWQTKTGLDPSKSSKWSLSTKDNMIMKERWADLEGQVIWEEHKEGRHWGQLSCGAPPEKLCTLSEMPWGCPRRCTWQCHAHCLESWMNLSGLGTNGCLPSAAP